MWLFVKVSMGIKIVTYSGILRDIQNVACSFLNFLFQSVAIRQGIYGRLLVITRLADEKEFVALFVWVEHVGAVARNENLVCEKIALTFLNRDAYHSRQKRNTTALDFFMSSSLVPGCGEAMFASRCSLRGLRGLRKLGGLRGLRDLRGKVGFRIKRHGPSHKSLSGDNGRPPLPDGEVAHDGDFVSFFLRPALVRSWITIVPLLTTKDRATSVKDSCIFIVGCYSDARSVRFRTFRGNTCLRRSSKPLPTLSDHNHEIMATGLPAGWEVRHSNSKNLPYYFNTATKDSRWEPPHGTDGETLKNYMGQYHTGNVSNNGATQDLSGKIRCAHLLVKHRDSRRPSSWREANITRSKDDARAIVEGHQAKIRAGSASLGDLATTESDCSSARKRDLNKEYDLYAYERRGPVMVSRKSNTVHRASRGGCTDHMKKVKVIIARIAIPPRECFLWAPSQCSVSWIDHSVRPTDADMRPFKFVNRGLPLVPASRANMMQLSAEGRYTRSLLTDDERPSLPPVWSF
nr:peptidyl-prolyl cis-trans isomerase ssp-1 [Quercus suber]